MSKEIAPLKKEYEQLSGRAGPLTRKIQDAENDASRKDTQASREKDANKAKQLPNDADRIRNSIQNERQELNRLQGKANAVRSSYNHLEGRYAALVQKFRSESGKLTTTLTQLKAKEKNLDQREQDDKRPATGDSGSVKSAEARLTALATYLPLVLDAEKQRLIDSFEKK